MQTGDFHRVRSIKLCMEKLTQSFTISRLNSCAFSLMSKKKLLKNHSAINKLTSHERNSQTDNSSEWRADDFTRTRITCHRLELMISSRDAWCYQLLLWSNTTNSQTSEPQSRKFSLQRDAKQHLAKEGSIQGRWK